MKKFPSQKQKFEVISDMIWGWIQWIGCIYNYIF